MFLINLNHTVSQWFPLVSRRAECRQVGLPESDPMPTGRQQASQSNLGILRGRRARSSLRVLKLLLDFVALLTGLIREWSGGCDLQIVVQVVHQGRIVLQRDM